MRLPLAPLGLALLALSSSCTHVPGPPAPAELGERSRALARRLIIADGHIDTPHRLIEKLGPDGEPSEDVSQRTPKGDFDHPRAVEGGLDVAFMSIYLPSSYQKSGGAKAYADTLIDLVEKLARKSPEKFALAYSVEEARRNSREGKVSFALGMENGAGIEDRLENVAHFHRRGVRYITLTHSEDNLLSDSSYSPPGSRTWKGLSPFGRQVVREMNRLGIMVDVSHLSDEAILQVLEVSKVPVIASHSSCRQLTPGWERNLSDELIRAVAQRGGVVMINFGSNFLTRQAHAFSDELRKKVLAYAAERKLEVGHPEVEAYWQALVREQGFPYARVEDVADHIDHVVKLAGIDHVGLGSDFDGVGDTLPTGLKDVSAYPNLFRVLLERGYSEADIEKVASGNVFRVWQQAESYAASQGHR